MSTHSLLKQARRERRHRRVRATISGTSARPRLSVYRSNVHMTAQIIDDVTGRTLVFVNTVNLKPKGTKTEQATAVGQAIAEAAKAKGITEVVFDRGGFLYHGRIKALAEAARAAGLTF